jgi:hypothetical protein
MLIVTARNALQERYGSDGYAQIRGALDAWAAIDGNRVVAVDDPADMQAMKLPVATAVPADIPRAIREAYRLYPTLAQSVLLAGGSSILPFFSLTNPVNDRSTDPDPNVLSDNPYGALADTLPEFLAPSLPVGRLAVPDDAGVNDFVALIESFPHRASGSAAGQPGSALVVNQDWADFSRRVAQALPDPLIWHLAPGYEMNAATRQDAARSILYFNLHGFIDQPDWQCYSMVQKDFVPAVTPDGIDRSAVAGALSFAECCYGAQIQGRSADDSCALKLVQEGASFIGATGLAFGSYIASDLFLEDADFLARAFFQGVGAGQPIGSALSSARRLYYNDSSEARSGNVWQYKRKTLLQFVLLGNPQTVH